MKVYLIRHGEAVPGEVDKQRPLSEKGIRDAIKIGKYLKRLSITADAIIHSGKKRAEGTAFILARETGFRHSVEQREHLLPDDDIDDAVYFLKNQDGDIILVGHMPFLSYLASYLLCGVKRSAFLEFPPAGAVCLERKDSQFHLVWAVQPDIIG